MILGKKKKKNQQRSIVNVLGPWKGLKTHKEAETYT